MTSIEKMENNSEDTHFLLEKEFTHYSSVLLYLLIAMYLASCFFFFHNLFTLLICLGGTMLNIVCLLLIRIIPPIYIKKCVKIFIFFQFGFLLALNSNNMSFGNTSTLCWFVVTLVFLHSIYREKSIKFFVAVLVSLLAISVLLAFLLYKVQFASTAAVTVSMPLLAWLGKFDSYLLNIVFALLFVCCSLYYLRRCNQLEINALYKVVNIKKKMETDNLSIRNYEEEYKYSEIFRQIEHYFEKEKPYLQANFKIGKMAHDLNINHSYLSKAIRINGNVNFNDYVNRARVEFAKKMIKKNENKYTLEYIYLMSGFKSQPIFNTAFKAQEGVTPSEYMKSALQGSSPK